MMVAIASGKGGTGRTTLPPDPAGMWDAPRQRRGLRSIKTNAGTRKEN